MTGERPLDSAFHLWVNGIFRDVTLEPVTR